MDSNWLEWRRYEKLWDEFEDKGWELGPVRYVNLPPTLAEFGPYRIAFRYRDPETEEDLFEVRELCDGEERRTLSVWGVPTPREAEDLLEHYGVEPDELPEEIPSEATAESEGSWGGLLPSAVYASEPR